MDFGTPPLSAFSISFPPNPPSFSNREASGAYGSGFSIPSSCFAGTRKVLNAKLVDGFQITFLQTPAAFEENPL